MIFNSATFSGTQIGTLGANQAANSLTFSSNTATAITLADGALALGTGGITVSAGAAAHTIKSAITFGGAQVWTNNSANPLTISGIVGGTGGLTKLGSGTLTVANVCTYTGPTTISEGTLKIVQSGPALQPAPGASLWLNASDSSKMTFSGGDTITAWGDSAGGTGGVANGTGIYTPSAINGKPAVHFSANAAGTSGTYLYNTTNYASPVTVFAVDRYTSVGNTGRIIAGNGNNWLLGMLDGKIDEAYFAGWVNNPGTAGDTNPHMYEAIIRGAGQNSTFSVYDSARTAVTKLAENTGGTAGPNGLRLNGYSNALQLSNCDVAEVLIYPGVLSGAALAQTESYLIGKYWGGAAGGSLPLNGPVTISGSASLDVTDSKMTIGPLSGSGSVLLGAGKLTVNSTSFSTFSGPISGAGGGMVKGGSGTLILSGANSYSGGTTINGGVLQFDNAAAMPVGAGNVTIQSGGALAVAGPYTTVTDWLGSSKIAAASNGALALAASSSESIDMSSFPSLSLGATGSATYSGELKPGANTYRFGGGGGSLILDRAVGDGQGGAKAVVINTGGVAAGSVVFTGSSSNSYTGGTTLNAGKLVLNKPAGTTAIPGNVTIATTSGYANSANGVELAAAEQVADSAVISFTGSDWSVFRLKGFNETVAGISCSNGKGVIEDFGDSQTNLNQNAVLTVNAAAPSSYNGILRGVTTHGNSTLGLTKTGDSMLALNGSNITYTGPTTVNAGILQLNQAIRFNSPIANNATVEFYSVDSFASKNNSVYLNAIQITGGTVKKTGSGQVHWQGSAIKVAAQINIQDGLLGADALTTGWLQNTADIDVASGAVLDLRGSPISLDVLTGAGEVYNSYPNGVNLLTVGVNNGSGTFSGVIYGTQDGNPVDGTSNRGKTSVVKTGTGTQTFTGAGVYSGATTVNNGTLAIAEAGGTIASSTSYTVNGSGTVKLDNSAANCWDRLSDTAIITLGGGTLAFVGNGSEASSETTGPVSLAPGDSTAVFSGDVAAGPHVLTASPGTRAAGGTLTLIGTDANHQLFLTGLSDGILGAGYFAGGNYAWYESGSGILRAVAYGAGGDPNTVSQGDVPFIFDTYTRLTASRSGQDAETVRTLNLHGSGVNLTLNDLQTLTLSDGGLLKTGGGDPSTISGGLGLATAAVDLIVRTETAGDAITLATALSGTGVALTKSGPGKLLLLAANAYDGGTFLNAGTLQVGAGGFEGDLGAGNIQNNGSLLFNRDGSVTVAGDISGSGSIGINGPGTVTLSGTPSYRGTTTINGGTLSFTKSLGPDTWRGGLITVNANGVLDSAVQAPFGYPSAGTNNVLADIFVNGGAVHYHSLGATLQFRNLRMNGGTLDTLGTDSWFLTYGDVTVDASSTAAIQNSGGTAGGWDVRNPFHDTIVDVGDNATLSVSIQVRSSDYGGSKKGLNKVGSGTLILAADNTYTGGTTINAGIVQVGNGGTTGNLGTGNVVNNASLVFNRDGTATIPGNISGTGSVTKTGPGAVVLSGANTYTGGTTLSEGLLSFNTSLPGTDQIAVPAGTYLGAAFMASQANFLDRLNKPASAGVVGVEATTSGNLDLTGFDASVRLGSRTAGTVGAESVITPLGSTYRLGGGGGVLTVRSALTGARDLEVGTSGTLAAGTVVLAGANSYTGATNVKAGTLRLLPAAVVANPALWLDATDVGMMSVDGTGRVSLWRDRAGGIDKVSQAAPERQPSLVTAGDDLINGLPVIKFNGPQSNGQCLTNTTNYPSPVSVFYVSKLTGGLNYRLLSSDLAGGGNNWLLGYWGGRMDEAYFQGWVNDPGPPADSSSHLYEAIVPGPGSDSQVYVYDERYTSVQLVTQNQGGTAGPNRLSLGGNGNEYSNGAIGELLIYNRVLGATERATVENYLISKWFGSGSPAPVTDYIPDASPVALADGAALDLAGNSETIGSLTGEMGSSVLLGGGTLITGGNNSTTEVASAISGSGALVKTGSGTMTLSGSNTYTGGTTVSGGALKCAASDALPTAGPLQLGGGGRLDLGAYDGAVGAVTLVDGSIIGTGALTGSSFAVQKGSITTSLAGEGGLTKTASGTVALSGSNTYTGGTTVSEGILEIRSAGALPAGSALTIASGGTVVLSSGLSVAGASIGGATQPVPEPGAWVLLVAAAMCALALGLRRRR